LDTAEITDFRDFLRMVEEGTGPQRPWGAWMHSWMRPG